MELSATAFAGFLALLIAVLTALKLVSENFERTMASLRRWRDSRRRPKYILIPTAEELARYSVQEPQRHFMDPIEAEIEWSRRNNEALWTRVQVRVAMIMFMFFLLFAGLGSRLLYLALVRLN